MGTANYNGKTYSTLASALQAYKVDRRERLELRKTATAIYEAFCPRREATQIDVCVGKSALADLVREAKLATGARR